MTQLRIAPTTAHLQSEHRTDQVGRQGGLDVVLDNPGD